ncbi:MAG: LysM peptidoglycan-binding domain-containing protein [Chloroflexi bacterium]|nr:LysM peptidoglycan-binding domain-containing protein [Chloroflexota bacterium]
MNKQIPLAISLIVLGLCLILMTACRAEVADAPALPTDTPSTSTAIPTHTPFPSPPPPLTATLPSEPATIPAESQLTEPTLVEYTVQPGDTLLAIAMEYDLSMAAIQLENGMGDITVVQVGQVFSIPTRDYWAGASRFWVLHVVKAGETLVGIAQTYGLTAAEIKAANGLSDADLIRTGQELVLPLDAPAVPQAPAPTDTPVPAPTTAPDSSPTPQASNASLAPTSLPVTVTPLPAGIASWPYEMVQMINQIRAQHGLAPLTYNETLAQAAQAHANDCSQRGWCNHTGTDGSDVKTRILRAGYDAAGWAECWAQQQTLQDAVNIWMDEVPPDDAHRRTLLTTGLSEVGVGMAKTGWGYYFIADFGKP